MNKILLGFEVPTGQPIWMNLHHTVVTGMTQLSGKTTALEAIISRSGLRAIAFKTKRGESGFNNYHEIPPFFRQRADWMYVQDLLEATMKEKMKFERRWIMDASRGAKTLKEVYNNVLKLKAKSRKDSLAESIYVMLDEYLQIVIPQIDKFDFSTKIQADDGINVMDLTAMTLEMRSLVIRSVMEYAADEMSNIIVIVPEAWEYIPQGRGNPVKAYAESFIRKGAAIGNYLFVDSQDIAGIDKTPLRGCDNWILGRQKEQNEVDRTRDELGKKVSDSDIKNLTLGQFWAYLGNNLNKVYMLPAGVPQELGIQVAMGALTVEDVKEQLFKLRNQEGDEDLMWKEKYEEVNTQLKETLGRLNEAEEKIRVLTVLKGDIEDLQKRASESEKRQRRVEELEGRVKYAEENQAETEQALSAAISALNAFKDFKAALINLLDLEELLKTSKAVDVNGSDTPTAMNLKQESVTVNVTGTVERVINVDASKNWQGKILQVMVKAKKNLSTIDISTALAECGWVQNPEGVRLQLIDLVKNGLVRKEGETRNVTYRLPLNVNFVEGEQPVG